MRCICSVLLLFEGVTSSRADSKLKTGNHFLESSFFFSFAHVCLFDIWHDKLKERQKKMMEKKTRNLSSFMRGKEKWWVTIAKTASSKFERFKQLTSVWSSRTQLIIESTWLGRLLVFTAFDLCTTDSIHRCMFSRQIVIPFVVCFAAIFVVLINVNVSKLCMVAWRKLLLCRNVFKWKKEAINCVCVFFFAGRKITMYD